MNSNATSVFSCAAWLRDFLQRRSLVGPDQRPLYSYHCTAEEYRALGQLLSDLPGFEAASKDPAACACFVLFCSEWYRHEYQREHGWTWDPIWQVLGYSISAGDLSRAVPKGLEGFWKRPIRVYDSDRRNFLGSLFGEGGLPFKLLAESDSKFQALFSRILRSYDQAHAMGQNTYQQVELLVASAGLPQAFLESTSIELIAGMADQLVSFASFYDLYNESEPVKKLDVSYPQWREVFPLPLDHSTGTELLNGLLKKVVVETAKTRRQRDAWQCAHYWEESSECLKLQLSMPEIVAFNLAFQPATTRFDLALREGDNELVSLGPGYATVENGVARVRLRRRNVILRRKDHSASLSLVATAGGLVLAAVPVPNSIVALGDVPVGFEHVNDRWQLCGQASFSSRSETVLLVVPKGASCECDEESVLSEAGPEVLSLRSLILRGRAEFRVLCDEVFRIRTGCNHDSTARPELVGASLDWPTKPQSTFLGVPRVYWPHAEGQAPEMNGDLFVAGRRITECSAPELLGVQYLSVRNKNGDTLLRRRLGVLPSDFRIELRRGDQPDKGSVLVYTAHNCLTSIEAPGIRSHKLKHADHIEFQLDAQGMPPAKLELTITPNLLGDEITVEVPFPSSGCLAFSADGTPLKREISIDELLGTRAFLFGKPGAPTRFELELSLRGSVANSAHYHWRYLAGEKPVEVSLFSIRDKVLDLFSLQSGIDQVVELRVFGGGHEASYRVRKYETEVFLDSDRNLLSAANLRAATYPVPELMLLHEPARKTCSLSSRLSEGVATGEYELPALVDKEGPWLVVPNKASSVTFRPLFLAGNTPVPSPDEAIHSLQKAVLAFDPNADTSAFLPVFDSMAVNPMHSGWQFLRTLYDQFGYLPLGTFEVWKALVVHPCALAMALFKFEMDATFIGRVETEFPFLWECFPIRHLHRAGQRFGAFLKVKGIPEQAASAVLERMAKKLGEAVPAFGENIQRYLANQPLDQNAQLDLPVLQGVVRGHWYQELLRDRADAEWPDFRGSELQRWCAAQDECVVNFEPEMSYRNAVVYLPVFLAAVASGKAEVSDVFGDGANTIFFLRQIRDLDSRWFSSLYQISLLRNLLSSDKDL